MHIDCIKWEMDYIMTIHKNQFTIGKMILLPSAMKLRRLCFYRCLFVHRGEYLTRYTPRSRHPPGSRHPLGPGAPPRTRYTPQDQVPSRTMYPPGPGTPTRTRYPPGPGPPPPGPGTPQNQVHPPWPGTPPWDQVHPLQIQPLLRMVRILLECILVYLESILYNKSYM